MASITLSYSRLALEPEVIEALDNIELILNENMPDGLSSTDLLNEDHWINNRGKRHGLMVTLVDNNKTVWASGNGKNDAWVNYDGVDLYVPV